MPADYDGSTVAPCTLKPKVVKSQMCNQASSGARLNESSYGIRPLYIDRPWESFKLAGLMYLVYLRSLHVRI